jgi:hypothetical protein
MSEGIQDRLRILSNFILSALSKQDTLWDSDVCADSINVRGLDAECPEQLEVQTS